MSNLRLTLRTLLAYLDDTLNPNDARAIGQKVAENPDAGELVERIRRVCRKRSLSTPNTGADGGPSDPNIVADYLSDSLPAEKVADFEAACLESDVHLAEVSATHQILTMVLSEPLRVPPTARKRMYQLVKGRESIPDRKPGDVVSVGGVAAEESPRSTDESDAHLLLGLSAFTRNGSPARRAGIALGLLGGVAALAAAVWFAVPGQLPTYTPPQEFAAVTPPTPVTPPPAAVVASPSFEVAPLPKPVTAAIDEGKKVEIKPPVPVTPPVAVEVPAKKDVPEPAVGMMPPKSQVVLAGRLEKSLPTPILFRRIPDDERWARVILDDPVVMTNQRLLCLPGYRANIKLDSGAMLELWGSVPDLFPTTLLESSVTLHPPEAGFDADLTVHAGRIYLAAKKPGGEKVRIRFADQVWEVTLTDEKSEVAFELSYLFSRGAATEPSRVSSGLAVVAGSAGLKTKAKEVPQIKTGEHLFWDSQGPGLVGPKKQEEGGRSGYFAKLQLPQDAEQAKRTLAALDELSKRLTDPNRAKAIFAEMLQNRADDGAPAVMAAARLGVYCQAAMGDWAGLVEDISDVGRPFVREAAVSGLQSVLAQDLSAVPVFRQTLIDKANLTAEQADTAIRLLRGFPEADKKNPSVMERLVEALSSNAVCIRELAFMNLVLEVDPDSRTVPALIRFDAGGPEASRETAVKAWKKRIEDLRKKS